MSHLFCGPSFVETPIWFVMWYATQFASIFVTMRLQTSDWNVVPRLLTKPCYSTYSTFHDEQSVVSPNFDVKQPALEGLLRCGLKNLQIPRRMR